MHDTERKKSLRDKQMSLDDLIKNFHQEVGKGSDSLNLAVIEGQMEFGKIIGVKETQPGCSHWDDSLNDAIKEGQMEFGVAAGSASKSDDGDGIEGVIEFRVITGEGDEIEIELEPQNVSDQERQEKTEPISDREKQDHMAENDDEQWSENDDD